MLVLRGGWVVDPDGGVDAEADLLVRDGRVAGVAPAIDAPDDAEVVDVTGCWIAPGLVDLRTHLREPGDEHEEDLESGLAAGAHGGFTALCAMPGTHPVNDTRAVTELIRARASQLEGPEVWPFGAITVGLKGEALTEMGELQEAGCVGVTDDRRSVSDAGLLRRAMEYARTFDLVVAQHCEEPGLHRGSLMHEGPLSTRLGLRGSPAEAEVAAVTRDLQIAALTGARFHVSHVSTAGAVDAIRRAKAAGQSVSADVTPHHLTYTDQALATFDTNAKVLPPLRSEADRAALRRGLEDGTLDAIATDHAPHASPDKDCELAVAAFGMIGLETALPMVLELVRAGHLSRRRAVEALSAGPARVVGASRTLQGADAFTVIDPEREWTVDATTLRSRSRNTPLLGQKVRGAARLTFARGRVVHRQPPPETP